MKDYLRGIWAALNNRSVALKYPWSPRSQPGQSVPVYSQLLPQIIEHKNTYDDLIHEILTHVDRFKDIPGKNKTQESTVYWDNDYLPGLDMVMIYTLINKLNPANIIEIGSGHSTAVMRKALNENHLQSRITCIDPRPRRDIMTLADKHIPKSLESLGDHTIFLNLSPGDIVFFDGSHISLANSDVTVFFMEILPYIPVGVYVQVHDIYLPFDYPEDMKTRGYNEQYLLAQALMYHQNKFEIVFPGFWISNQKGIQSTLDKDFWSKMKYDGIQTHGGSFWFKIVGT